MKFLALLLVVGTTNLSLTAAMPQELPPFVQAEIKRQITSKLCSGNPSKQSQCMTEVEECLEFLQMDPTAENPPKPDLEKICNGTAKPECNARVAECGKLFAKGAAEQEPQSLTSLDTLPTKENLELMCTFMKMDNCTQTFEKCFELIGPTANITGFPTREMFECSKVFDDYIEVTKNISGTADAPGPFPSSGTDPTSVNGTIEASVSTDEESSVPSRQTMEIMCRASEVTNCVDRAEECFQLVGPGASPPTTITTEMIECSEFLRQFADPTDEPVDPAVIPETEEGSVDVTPEEPTLTKEMIEAVCQSSTERNCAQRFEECFTLVGPGSSGPDSDGPETITREMIECSAFLQNFTDIMDNVTGTTEATTTSSAVPGRDVTGTTRRGTTTTTTTSTTTATPDLNNTTTTSRTTTERTSSTGDSRARTTTERTDRTRRTTTTTTTTETPATNKTLSKKEMIEGVCEFLEIPNCVNRVDECLMISESNTANRRETQKCATVISSYEDIKKNLTQRIAAEHQVCETENCKRCETLIRPTRSFTASEDECRTNTELTLKECMEPKWQNHLRLVARPDIRRKIGTFLENCYPENSYGGIPLCIIKKCEEII